MGRQQALLPWIGHVTAELRRGGHARACARAGRTPAATTAPSALHTPCAPSSGVRGPPTQNDAS